VATGHSATIVHAFPTEGDEMTDSDTADPGRMNESADMVETRRKVTPPT